MSVWHLHLSTNRISCLNRSVRSVDSSSRLNLIHCDTAAAPDCGGFHEPFVDGLWHVVQYAGAYCTYSMLYVVHVACCTYDMLYIWHVVQYAEVPSNAQASAQGGSLNSTKRRMKAKAYTSKQRSLLS